MFFLSRRCLNVENAHETFLNTKIPFQKRTFYDNRVQNIPQLSLETSLPRLVQNKPSALIRCEENKFEFFEREFQSEKLSFVHKKESEHSFEPSLSTCVFYRRFFNLEMQNFSLKSHHMMSVRQPFCWRMTSTKMSNSPASSPPPMWSPIWLLWGRGYVWFILGKNFFLKPLELEIFSLTYNGATFFQHYIRHEGNFFQCRIFFFSRYILASFSLSKSV